MKKMVGFLFLVFQFGFQLHGAAPIADQNRLNRSLRSAASRGNVAAVTVLLESGADVNAPDPMDGLTALMLAALQDHKEVVSELIASDETEIDKQDKDGETALMIAAGSGHMEVVQQLLDAGADIDLEDDEGKTAKDFARENAHDDIANMLTTPMVKSAAKR